MKLTGCLFLVLALSSGCAHTQLRSATTRTAVTLTELQYQQVLNNIAMLLQDPYALPSHVRVTSGAMNVSDTLGVEGGLTWAPGAGAERSITPSGSRQTEVGWEVSPVTDADQLLALRGIYQQAVEAEVQDRGFKGFAATTSSTQPTTVPAGTWYQVSRVYPIGRRYVGRYGGLYVSVEKENYGKLAEFTLAVLRTAPPEPADKLMRPLGLFRLQ